MYSVKTSHGTFRQIKNSDIVVKVGGIDFYFVHLSRKHRFLAKLHNIRVSDMLEIYDKIQPYNQQQRIVFDGRTYDNTTDVYLQYYGVNI